MRLNALKVPISDNAYGLHPEITAPLKTISTPFYLYGEKRIRENIERFRDIAFNDTRIHFATMANDNPRLLDMLKRAGFGVFVNSLKHLALVLAGGFEIGDVIFASTGISPKTMRILIKKGVHLNLDSLGQVALYGALNPGGRAGIRLTIDEKSKNNVFIGAESRIGIMESELEQLFEVADRHSLDLAGVHVYLGTDVTSIDDILAGVEKTLAMADHFPKLTFVDLGGGFPIDRSRFDFEVYNRRVSEMLDAYAIQRRRPIRMIIEPGRAMFGDAAWFFTTVTDVKERPDRFLVCCDASASLIPRAMFYEDYNPVWVDGADDRDVFDKPVDIVGSTTYSRDFLGKRLRLPKVEIGDRLVFGNAGSYCYSMITRFLGQALPHEYLLNCQGELELIRAGEHFFSEVV
jgi:diaminopimelate decarboxylase